MDNKLELFDEQVRRATYKTWIFKSNKPCSADKMSEAGFIFTGSSKEPDSAQCFFCGKSLDGWEATDDPWTEHFKHAPNCDFAKMQKSQDSWTLSECLDIMEKFRKILVTKRLDEAKKQIKRQFDMVGKMIVNY